VRRPRCFIPSGSTPSAEKASRLHESDEPGLRDSGRSAAPAGTDRYLGAFMPTLTAEAHREQMLRCLEQGRAYAFLSMTAPYLAACPDDGYVRMMAAREYLALGLVEPARELLDHASFRTPSASGLEQVREQLAPLGATIVPWSTFTERYEANRAVLRSQPASASGIREAWIRREPAFRLFRDRHGVFHVQRRGDDGEWRWIPAFRNHVDADASHPLPEDIGQSTPGPYLFEGLGLGGLFERIYHLTVDTFLGFSCALFIVEPDPAALAVVLHLRDWRTILADGRVRLITGEDWAARLGEMFEREPDLPLPGHVITTGTPDERRKPRPAEVVTEAAQRRQIAIQSSWARVERMYAGRDAAYWARRLEAAVSGSGPPLRVLSAVSRHTTFLQHSMRDARRALEALGHECRVLIERAPYEVMSPLTFHRAILELEPDLYLALDHIRPEFRGVVPADLPILTWDQDQLPHVFTPDNIRQIGRHDYIVGCSKPFLVTQGLDARQMLHARMPTCPEQFGGPPLTDEELEEYRCDVSFVSHASQTPQQFHEQERASYQDARCVRLLDTLFELMPEGLGPHRTPSRAAIERVLAEGMRRCGILRLDEALRNRLTQWYLWRLGDRWFRHEALAWAAHWARRSGRTLRIYGNGWDAHPALSEFASGPAANGRELLCIYRASRINLQLMPAGFLHQRALDGLAAGGFFLCRATPRDLRGRLLRDLIRRVDELGVDSTAELLHHGDVQLRDALAAYLDDGETEAFAGKLDVLQQLRMAAEVRFPDEEFSAFEQIVFTDSVSFEACADRFLNDADLRTHIAQQMRAVVVERYSYRAALERFVRAMTDYLHELVTEVADRGAPT